MSNSITYVKANGTEIEVSDNPANRAHAVANGWKEKAKRGRPAKAETE